MSATQSSHFKFKQFSLWHDQCGMKVSTDGVALGTWAELVECPKDKSHSGSTRVLDIGTGTGLLALMLAQRYAQLYENKGKIKHTEQGIQDQQTHITALELDPAAAQQARFNIEQSPWPDAVSVVTTDVNDWSQAAENCAENCAENSTDKYDHIICNPPYFSNSLNSPDQARDQARHNDSLSFDSLAKIIKRHLTSNGHFELILPIEEAKRFDFCAANAGLANVLSTSLQHSPTKTPNRLLVRYKHTEGVGNVLNPKSLDTPDSRLIIRDEDGRFHPSFAAIANEFYLKL